MDVEILFTILVCVIAAVITLVSLFFFAKRKQKSYEEVLCDWLYCIIHGDDEQVKQDEIKADIALSKELSNTPRSKPAARQYHKPWMARKKKPDEAPTDSSAHVTPDPAHMISSEPIQINDEIVDQPVVKVTKKKRPQQSVPPSSSLPVAIASTNTVTTEAATETKPAITVEAVLVEE